jgi:hypothetical protein
MVCLVTEFEHEYRPGLHCLACFVSLCVNIALASTVSFVSLQSLSMTIALVNTVWFVLLQSLSMKIALACTVWLVS